MNKFFIIYKITNKFNGKIYIGKHITSNLEDGYMGSGKLLKLAIIKYGIKSFEKSILEFCEDRDKLNEREKFFISENIGGYNIAKGGEGGFTVYNKDRNKKISLKLKGRDNSSWIKKAGETKKINGSHKGIKNIKAKKWALIDPAGNVIHLHGNLEEKINEYNLLSSSLRYYKNETVPPIKYNGYGGFRAKTAESKILRENTSGWSLIELMEK